MRIVVQLTDDARLRAVDNVEHLLVYDGDTLLAIMWCREDGTIGLTRVGEKDFNRLVEQFGVSKRTDVRCVTVKS